MKGSLPRASNPALPGKSMTASKGSDPNHRPSKPSSKLEGVLRASMGWCAAPAVELPHLFLGWEEGERRGRSLLDFPFCQSNHSLAVAKELFGEVQGMCPGVKFFWIKPKLLKKGNLGLGVSTPGRV